jgi:hypothetical protein
MEMLEFVCQSSQDYQDVAFQSWQNFTGMRKEDCHSMTSHATALTVDLENNSSPRFWKTVLRTTKNDPKGVGKIEDRTSLCPCICANGLPPAKKKNSIEEWD